MSNEYLSEIRADLVAQIEANQSRRKRIRIGPLLERFGYQAQARVRTSSLEAVLDCLEQWGIEYEFATWDRGVQGRIVLSLREEAPAANESSPSGEVIPPSEHLSTVETLVDPFELVFYGRRDPRRRAIRRARRRDRARSMERQARRPLDRRAGRVLLARRGLPGGDHAPP